MANKPMRETTLSAVVKSMLEDAIDYSEELGEMRINSTDAYQGGKYGNEQPGRSQLVTREVRDAVEVAKPALMRIFFGTHKVVEYAPRGPEDVQAAKESTAYMDYVVNDGNPGYMEFLSAVDDALIRKTGVLKSWWEESDKPVGTQHTGLTMDEIELLEAEDDVTDIEIEETGETAPAMMPPMGSFGPEGEPMAPPEPEPLFDATVTRIETSGRLRFQAVPPEEFVINRSARSVEDAMLVGHHRNVTLSYLRELGYSEEDVEELAGTIEDQDEEKDARSEGDTDDDEYLAGDDSQRQVAYAEIFVKIDYDGDGIAELRRICVAGSAYEIMENELADEAPFAVLCPSPTAHQAIGGSLAELAEDIQKIKTMIMRNTLDSLAGAIHPDVAAVEGAVNFDDLLSTEMGRIVRMKQPGMVQYMNQPFIGQQVYPMLQYMDTLVEARTGMNEASQGLNADALQSTSSSAIDNATQSAQSRIEFIARTFIEGGLKRFYKLMLKLSIENADRATMIRLNNQFTPVDPRSWNADMDVMTAVPLGAQSMEERLTILQTVAAKQEQAIQTGGPDNPIAGIKEYSNTLREISRLGGIKEVNQYFKDPDDPASTPEPQPQEPGPEEILAQAEMARTKASTENDQRKLDLDVWKAIQEDDRQRDKDMADVMLRAAKLRQDGVAVDEDALRAEFERDRQGHAFALQMLQESNQQKQQEAQQQQAKQQAQQQAQQKPKGGPQQ